jgi:hypothetical protein
MATIVENVVVQGLDIAGYQVPAQVISYFINCMVHGLIDTPN